MENRVAWSLLHALSIETFQYTWPDGKQAVWDIRQCETWLSCRPHLEDDIPCTVLEDIVASNDPDLTYLAYVDPRIPGIAAPIMENGDVVYILIDGNKRAAKLLMNAGRSFRVRLLSDAESRACVIRCDDWTRLP